MTRVAHSTKLEVPSIVADQKPQTSSSLKNVSGPRILKKPNPIRERAEKFQQSLVQQYNNPANWPRLRALQSTVRLHQDVVAQLTILEQEKDYSSHNEAVKKLLEKSREDLALPGNARSVYYGDAVVNVAGPSGIGKTTFVKSIKDSAPGPTLFVDPSNEYADIRNLTLGELISYKWAKAGRSVRIRFVPDANPHISRTELDLLFTQLNVLKQVGFQSQRQPSGSLHTWCIFLDEAHKLKNIESATAFINEARKFCRKLVVICSDPAIFGAISRIVRPPSLESMIPNPAGTKENENSPFQSFQPTSFFQTGKAE